MKTNNQLIFQLSMFKVVGHTVEIDIYITTSVGHGGGARRPQLGFLAAADRDADVHPHGV